MEATVTVWSTPHHHIITSGRVQYGGPEHPSYFHNQGLFKCRGYWPPPPPLHWNWQILVTNTSNTLFYFGTWYFQLCHFYSVRHSLLAVILHIPVVYSASYPGLLCCALSAWVKNQGLSSRRPNLWNFHRECQTFKSLHVDTTYIQRKCAGK